VNVTPANILARSNPDQIETESGELKKKVPFTVTSGGELEEAGTDTVTIVRRVAGVVVVEKKEG
jgi:hypothetical protein